MNYKNMIVTILLGMATTKAMAQNDSVPHIEDQQLKEVTVVTSRPGMVKSRGLMNAATINSTELTKAACCNLGESFTTNPSVDVSYSDAATGAKQIKLLGLSGTYVQMLTENIPNYRGAASPYSLGYVPGPWMQSIQVSKGAASVKNGYESITGQINIEFKKPQLTDQVNANVYGNSMGKLEANADGSIHLTDRWSLGLMLHYEDKYKNHDGNGDGFMDEPNVQQYNGQFRWAYFSPGYIFQAGVRGIKESRVSGQMTEHMADHDKRPYQIEMNTDRYEAFAKNALILNQEHNTNIALILNGSYHDVSSFFGAKNHLAYDLTQKNLYASLLFENDFTPMHNISAGISLNQDSYDGTHSYITSVGGDQQRKRYMKETTPGAYTQYTFNLNDKFIAMAGLRMDHTNIYHRTFVTPRAHLKWTANDHISLRASAGKGYRTVFPMAENLFLLSSGRDLSVTDTPEQEEAWNYGVSATFDIPLFKKNLQVNAEYYYTDFLHQVVVDYDSDPGAIRIDNLQGDSYSHTFQIDATYPVIPGLSLTAAYRRNIVKTTFGGVLMDKPLTSKYKGLLTASYKTALGLWQFDATLQLNGGGRMPAYLTTTGENTLVVSHSYHSFEQVNAQITRWFRHFSIYAGGENLTSFKQKNPIIDASNPWGTTFDPTLIYGPVEGAMFYIGIRFNLEKII